MNSYGVKEWQAPPFTASASERLSFCTDMTGEGEAWIKSQSAYNDIQKGLDIVSGKLPEGIPNSHSKLNTSRLKCNLRQVIGALSNIRPFWGYGSDAAFYRPSATMLNKIVRAVYLESFFDRRLKACLQYMAVTGTGYIWPKYRRSMYGYGPGNIEFDALGALDVLPVQMPQDNNLQEAYIVTIINMVPVAKAHGMFPLFQASLKPIARRRYVGSYTEQRMSLANRFKFGDKVGTSNFANLYSEIRYQYIMDISINTTGMPLPMGQPGTSWAYTVPYMGQQISVREPLSGEMITRPATPTDCRIYPRRRLMISTPDVLMYDGPAFDWSSMIPLARFSSDLWAWEGLGFSMAKDGYDYQTGINDIERGAQTVLRSRLRPGMTYDIAAGGSLNAQTAEALDPFAPDARIGIDTSGGGGEAPPLMPILPDHLLTIPPEAFALMEHYEGGMDYTLGLNGAQALTKLRANADSEAVEKLLDVLGPIIEDTSRDMEMGLRDVGNIVKFLVLQYMTTARALQYVGQDGISPATYDYDPDSLIPSHMPYEAKKMDAGEGSGESKMNRARHFADNLRLTITPNSVHEIVQMTRKLLMLQLKKGGFMIDSQTVAEACDIPNYGTIPGNTVIERYWEEQAMQIRHAAKLQHSIAEATAAADPNSPVPVTSPPPSEQPGGEPVGRPNVNTAPPKIEQKGLASGGRSTVTTSK